MYKFQYLKQLLSNLTFKTNYGGDNVLNCSHTVHILYSKRVTVHKNNIKNMKFNYHLIFNHMNKGIIALSIKNLKETKSLEIREKQKIIDILQKFPYLREENQDKVINMIELYLLER